MAYRTKTVAELTGIPRNTLVAWERRYRIVAPRRADNGYRLYSDQDVEVLGRLKTLVDGGLSISEAVEMVRARAGRPAAGAARGGRPLRAPGPGRMRSPPDVLRGVQESLLGFDRGRAGRELRALSGASFEVIIDEVLMPLVVNVGHGWETGLCTVAQEHFVTAWVRDQLVAMLARLEGGAPGGPLVACASPPGERHEIGLLGLSVRLALLGGRVAYLGIDLPLEALGSYCRLRRPAVACLSVTKELGEDALRALASAARAAVPAHTSVVIGGRGAIVDPGLPGVHVLTDPSAVLSRAVQRGVAGSDTTSPPPTEDP